MKVKIISTNKSLYDLEEKINTYLDSHQIEVLDIKYSNTEITSMTQTLSKVKYPIYSAMIVLK